MPMIGRLDTSRSARESWNVGNTWLATRLAARPTRIAAANANDSSSTRLGATGCGSARGEPALARGPEPRLCLQLSVFRFVRGELRARRRDIGLGLGERDAKLLE